MRVIKTCSTLLLLTFCWVLITIKATATPVSIWSEQSPVAVHNDFRVVKVLMQAPGDPVQFDSSLANAADYLKGMQADITEDNAGNGTDGIDETPDDPDDGGWDWVVSSPPDPFAHSVNASPPNLYGVTATGLYYAYMESGESSYLTAMQDVADFIMVDRTNYRTAADVLFLLLFNGLPEITGTAYADSAKAKFDSRIADHGSATAFAEYIRDVRGVTQGYPNGIIAWDIGNWVRAAAMLETWYPSDPYDYAQAAVDMAEVLWQDSYNDNPGLFDIVDDAGYDAGYGDVNFWWYNLGLTGLIDAFSASGAHTAEIPGLVTKLLESQSMSGFVSFQYGGNAGDEDWQSTAYAMMSLGRLDQATYQTEINHMGYWIGATQDTSGGWLYDTGEHYPEIGGECATGLYYTTNTITDVIVDDDFTGQADVDVYNTAHGTDYLWGYDAFATIQEGVDAITEGISNTVTVLAGTYEEQVVIAKELTITGAGKDITIIQSPVTLTDYFTTSASNYPIVYVHDINNVIIDGVTVDGLGRGNSNYRFTGIAFWNAGGTVTNIHITGVRDTPFSGAQHGVSIYAYNTTWGPYTISIDNVNIDDMQKGGIVLNGNGVTAYIQNSTVDGVGATSVTAQVGIQLGYGTGGSVDNCTVAGIGYTGENWTASGMLFYNGTSVDVTNCTVDASQSSIVYQETQGTINGAIVTSTSIINAEGISVRDYGSIKNRADAPCKPVALFAEQSQSIPDTKAGPTTVTVAGVVVIGVHEPGSIGIASWSMGDDVVTTITGSVIQDWETGIVAYEESGSAVNVTAANDTIINNDVDGAWTNAALSQNFENNFWGASDGPLDNVGTDEVAIGQCFSVDVMTNTVAEFFPGEGLGNSVTGNIDYCPWVPWSCCVTRGNVDRVVGTSGPIDVADLTYLVSYLFQYGPPPPCEEEGNVDGIIGTSGPIDVADLTYLVSYLFQYGPEPPACE